MTRLRYTRGQRRMPLAPGSKLGRYDVVAFVGAGGMGEVYRARDTELGRDVAIKVLRPDRHSDDEARRRLTQEARTASALNHPHIAIVFDVAAADGVHFIVMEYVAGRPLSALIAAGLDRGEALRIAIAVSDALAQAHAAGIVHRDLKPANVVVSADGVPKVLDFGIAKLVDAPAAATPQDETTTELTGTAPRWPTSGFGGTPGYVAPEQVTGAKVDARSDIFSFGSMLYEMLTGRRAFRGATAAETIGEVLGRQPTPPREIVPDLPIELEQVVLRCLRKEPERRFQSIADVRVVLQDIADARVRPPPADGPVRDRRLSPWLAAGLAAAVAIAAASARLVAESRRRAAPRAAARALDHGAGDRVVADVLAGRAAVRVRLGRRDPAAGRQLELRSVGTAGGRHRGAPDHRRSGRRAGTELVAGRPLDRLPARTRRRDPAGPRRLAAGRCVAAARRDPGGADRDQLAARRAGVADHLDAGQPPRRVRPRRRTAGRHQRHRDRARSTAARRAP